MKALLHGSSCASSLTSCQASFGLVILFRQARPDVASIIELFSRSGNLGSTPKTVTVEVLTTFQIAKHINEIMQSVNAFTDVLYLVAYCEQHQKATSLVHKFLRSPDNLRSTDP